MEKPWGRQEEQSELETSIGVGETFISASFGRDMKKNYPIYHTGKTSECRAGGISGCKLSRATTALKCTHTYPYIRYVVPTRSGNKRYAKHGRAAEYSRLK